MKHIVLVAIGAILTTILVFLAVQVLLLKEPVPTEVQRSELDAQNKATN